MIRAARFLVLFMFALVVLAEVQDADERAKERDQRCTDYAQCDQ